MQLILLNRRKVTDREPLAFDPVWNGPPLLSPQPTQGLLAMDLVTLNHGRVTRTTPELAPLSPNDHIPPTRRRLSSRQI
ncbi:hypothetical protein TNCV_3077641 [Trichonephila clavipes]|nr:hypothetical protein TNCV_3077641 [Trichonephila clavipes]